MAENPKKRPRGSEVDRNKKGKAFLFGRRVRVGEERE